jgi:hypothetical protein
MEKLRIVTLGISGVWEVAHAAVSRRPPISLSHDCSPYIELHVRRERLGFVRRSRAIFCRSVPNPNVTIRDFFIIAVGEGGARAVRGEVVHVVAARHRGDAQEQPHLRGRLGQ